MSRPEIRRVARGRVLDVIYGVDQRAQYPSEEELQTIRSDNNRLRDWLSALGVMQRLADRGRITNREHFKKVEGTRPPLFEVKKHQLRILGCFWDFDERRYFVLLHAIIKKTDKLSTSTVDKAQRLREEHVDMME